MGLSLHQNVEFQSFHTCASAMKNIQLVNGEKNGGQTETSCFIHGNQRGPAHPNARFVGKEQPAQN